MWVTLVAFLEFFNNIKHIISCFLWILFIFPKKKNCKSSSQFSNLFGKVTGLTWRLVVRLVWFTSLQPSKQIHSFILSFLTWLWLERTNLVSFFYALFLASFFCCTSHLLISFSFVDKIYSSEKQRKRLKMYKRKRNEPRKSNLRVNSSSNFYKLYDAGGV